MSQRTRSGKVSAASPISPSKSKKKSLSTRTKKTSIKKASLTKRHNDFSSTNLTQPRQKRLSSLTAAALVHYCTSILSPSRKVTQSKKVTTSDRKRKVSNVSSKSDTKNVQTDQHTRTRREASSRASAMIMQQNEIERSRCTYTLVNQSSTTTVIRRQRTRSGTNTKNHSQPKQQQQTSVEPFQFNIPSVPSLPIPVPSIANVSNQSEHTQSSHVVTTQTITQEISINSKYPSLTEAILAEHDRLNESLPSYHTIKHDNLVRWTQELASYDRLSPHELPFESIEDKTDSSVKELTISSTMDSTTNRTTTPSSFLFPPAGYPLDLRSFYPLLPCWQYPGKQSNQ